MLKNVLGISKKGGKKKTTKRSRQGIGQSQKMGHVYNVNSGPVFAPLMPKEFSVALVDRQVIQINNIPAGSPTGYQTAYGLIEFLNKRPLYSTEFYNLYKFARVTAVSYHFEVVNVGTVPIEMLFCICPFSDAATLAQIGEKPGVIRHVISPVGGMDRRSMTKTARAEDWFGNPYFTRDYWVTQAQSTSVTPLDPDEPIGLFAVANLGVAAMAAATVVSRVTYHIQFFDLELNQSPTSSVVHVDLAQECDESDDMVLVPKTLLDQSLLQKKKPVK